MRKAILGKLSPIVRLDRLMLTRYPATMRNFYRRLAHSTIRAYVKSRTLILTLLLSAMASSGEVSSSRRSPKSFLQQVAARLKLAQPQRLPLPMRPPTNSSTSAAVSAPATVLTFFTASSSST